MGRSVSVKQSFLHLLVALFLSLGTDASSRGDQLQTLSAFKAALSTLPTWNSSTPLCSWSGITCKYITNGSFQVTAINLSGRNLTGKVNGVMLSQLIYLESLDLSNNKLTGDIPGDVFACVSLKYLNMSSNNLTGPIPSMALVENGLETLDLSNNGLTGEIPESLGMFKMLKYIDIGGNLLVGEIPESLTNVTSLETLTLASNQLTGHVPRGFGKMKNLRFLYLGYNNLSGEIPEEIGELTSLNHLNLVFNNLTGKIPSSIGNLSNLHYLFLYQNNLSGLIPKSIFGLRKLVSLDLSDNFLSGEVPELFGQLQELEILQLFSNQFSGKIPRSVARLPRLRVLQLWDNKFNGSIPGELGKYSNLTLLDLSTNSLRGKMPEYLCHSSHLSKLILFSNSIYGKIPKGVAQCRTLSRVRLENNSLSGEVPEEFWKLPLVKYLDLSGNKLSGSINEVKWEMGSLLMLKMSRNNFSGGLPESFGNNGFNTVDLSGNDFSGIIPTSFGNMSELVQLRLSHNNLSGTIPDELRFCRRLVYLDLSHNQLSGRIPPSISELPVLEDLDLSKNELTGEIPSTLGDMDSLVNVNVSYNHLHGSLPTGGPFLIIESSALVGNDHLCEYKPITRGLPECLNQDSPTQWWLIGFGVLIALLLAILAAFIIVLFVRKRRGLELTRRIKSEDGLWEVQFFDTKSSKSISFEDIMSHDYKEKNKIASGTNWSSYKGKSKSSGKEFLVTHWKGLNSVSSILWTALTQLGGNPNNNKAVKMIGICRSELDGCLIITECYEGRNLCEILPNLKWEERKELARKLARALQAVHSCTHVPIVDLSPEMITVDDKIEPNLHVILPEAQKQATFAVQGSGEGVGKREDIYSFGIILIVLASGKFPSESKFGPNQKSIVEWAYHSFHDPSYNVTWIDRRVEEQDAGHKELRNVMKLAFRCTSSDPSMRPSAKDVYKFLNSLEKI